MVEERTVRHDVQAFIDNVDSSLSVGTSKRNILYFEFSHDVYRMLFGSKESLNADDFCSRYFSLGWDCRCIKYGRSFFGCKIRYPIECKLYLRWNSKKRYFRSEDGEVVNKNRSFKEMLKVTLFKVNCS